ncbi:MAG TPA: hypothetical protein VL486_03965 [Verrucomicrobiae bacterium]|nr:hypothetical protein [Verrucomicrobiae bacterium]
MAIKVQPFVIDEAVLDLVGNEFKFDHAKGLAEWLKNSCDAYLREKTPDDEQFMIVRLVEDDHQHLARMECIDFVGMTKKQIDDAFKRFFDPQAAKKGAKEAQIKTLGGHGNGGKFYMRQMFKTSRAITYRDGRMNIFGFNAKHQYGFEEGFEECRMPLREAMEKAGIDRIKLPPQVKRALESGEDGFTVVVGEHPQKAKGSANRNALVEKFVMHPQARRLIARLPVHLLLNDDKEPVRLTAPKLSPKEGFEDAIIIPIPDELESEGKAVRFKNGKYSWTGRLVLRTSGDPLRGSLATLNTIDFIGEVGVIGSYRIHELGATKYSGQVEFIYGECECPILEDQHYDCVRNDRQKLLENDRSLALLEWVRTQVESLAEKMETKQVQEKKKQDLRNTSAFNELLNRWKNRFMGQVWAEMFAGKGPAGISGPGVGAVGGGTSIGRGGDGGSSGAGQEGGSEKKRKPRFPQVLISGQDNDPLDPLATVPFECDPRHPAVYQRPKDVEAGIYWINTSRPLAEKILSAYSADSARWREYLFQRYVDIRLRPPRTTSGSGDRVRSPCSTI